MDFIVQNRPKTSVLGIYKIFQAVICFPSGKTVEAIKYIHGKPDIVQRSQNALMPIIRLISKLIPMSEYRERRLAADFLRLNIRQSPKEYVSTVLGKSLLLGILGLLFIPLGIDNITAHMLRHTYASMLYEAGVDIKSAQRFLGHADVEMTLAVYTHLTKFKEEEAISSLNAHFDQFSSQEIQESKPESLKPRKVKKRDELER